MNPVRKAVIAALGGVLVSAFAQAQTPNPAPAPGDASSNPSAASSPHQREATSSTTHESQAGGGSEAADASTPAQHGSMKMADAGGPPPTATTFVQKAGQDGMTEVQLAKMALDKSKNEGVRTFATRMQKDHTKADTELMGIAAKKSITAPKELDSEHQAMVQEMSAKSGASFDASYAQHMAQAHDKAIALFTSGTRSSDADIAAFAKKTLPTLEEHKQLADSLNAKAKTAAAGADSTRR